MNTAELKNILIPALNHNLADDFCASIIDVMESYQSGGLRELETRLFRLSVDLSALEREGQKIQQFLAEYQQEKESAADDEWRMYANASQAVGMAMQ